ncbi:MAG: hypothetical protein AAGJ81_07015 [Verrucomicrobiota bacterium]
MKILSLILRIVTLAVIVALGVLWFLNKDEISAISAAYEDAGQQLNIPDEPLSRVITKGVNDLNQTKGELRDSQGKIASLTQQLDKSTEELSQIEDQLRSTNQMLRNTQRDLDDTQTELTGSKQTSDRQLQELDTVRGDLIRVNREKFELSQRIESVEEEKRGLARRVEQLEDSAVGSSVSAASAGGNADETVDQIARLQRQLEAAREEITRLSDNPLNRVLSASAGTDESLSPNQVRVKSLDLNKGLVVLSPSSSDEFIGVSNVVVNRDGAPVANLRLRGVYPDYVVAEILPDSAFANALRTGLVYTFQK